MKRFKQILAVVFAACCAVSALAQAPDRVVLAVAGVETVSMRTDKAFEPVPLPSGLNEKDLPYSEASMALMDEHSLSRALAENDRVRHENFQIKREIFLENYQRLLAHQKKIEDMAQKTRYGRSVIMARDYLASALSQHGRLFDVVHRTDGATAAREAMIADGDFDPAESHYFVRLLIGDLQETSKELPMEGGLVLRKSKSAIVFTVEVQDFRQHLVFSKTLEESISSTGNNVAISTGADDVEGRLIRKGCESCAEAVAGYFENRGKMAREAETAAQQGELEALRRQIEIEKAKQELQRLRAGNGVPATSP